MRVRNMLLPIIALAAVDGAEVASAQDPGAFVVDGDPQEWFGLNSFDTAFDVVPDTNSTVDIDSYGVGGVGGSEAFIFRFLAPPFQGEEETTVTLFYDVSNDSTFGALAPPWPQRFRPDFAFGVTGSNGALTKEFYWRYTGSAWNKKKGADIPELEVALSGEYLEGAYRDYLPDLSRGPYGDDRVWTDVDMESWGEIKAQ